MKLTCHFLLLLLVAHFSSPGQNKVRLPAWSFQDDHTTIIGMGVGLTTQEFVQVNTVGIRFELLGKGIGMLTSSPPHEVSVWKPQENIYGVNISPFGTFSQNVQIHGIGVDLFATYVKRVNGILISFPGIGAAAYMNGLEVSFLANFDSVMNGIQVGIGNFCQKKSVGIQIGAGNESDHHTGLQVGFGYNKAMTLSGGLQISLFYNKAMGISTGMQIGLGNYANDLRGIQIGLFNKANHLKGLQIGLLNISGNRILPIFNW
jgi:hypothetical protein